MISVAPMMGWTDRHERFLLRLITRRTLLYTEMVNATAILRGDRAELLDFDPVEHPVALQLGGADPAEMAEAARIGQDWGYDEINMNVGCPSDKVVASRFGACLMAEPSLVASCVEAMRSAVTIPVTVKCRIGIDDLDTYEHLREFVRVVSSGGCEHFIVHARKAWLQGLSAKQNRSVPPLRYEDVHRLKREFPALRVTINGGLRAWADVRSHLALVDGAMVGREAYENPYFLATVDRDFFGSADPVPTRREIAEGFVDYAARVVPQGVGLALLARHVLGLYRGTRRSGAWRRTLSEGPMRKGAGLEVLREAVALAEDGPLEGGRSTLGALRRLDG